MAGSWSRRIAIALGVLLGLILVLAATVYLVGQRRLRRSYVIPPSGLSVTPDSALIQRGAHLASAITKCTDCHGEALDGRMFIDGMPLGRFVAPNLTTGRGSVGPLSDEDWVRAIRHGVAPDGRPLVFMPALAYHGLSRGDLAAIIAWAKSRPPVDHQLPATQIGPIGRLLLAQNNQNLLSASHIDHSADFGPEPSPGPSAEYGKYLVVIGGCTMCHGPALKGGIQNGPPGTPPSADLTPGGPTSNWTEADFQKALRTGQRPDGTSINPFMPWRLTRLMTDEEIEAVWKYLRP
jgi:Cytochrome c/Cytochrome C oxidase, cbb3-type, subunit III